jgi:hypothetical protein
MTCVYMIYEHSREDIFPAEATKTTEYDFGGHTSANARSESDAKTDFKMTSRKEIRKE